MQKQPSFAKMQNVGSNFTRQLCNYNTLMITIDFETFKERLSLLENISSDLNKQEALQKFQKEDKKLTKENEQILIAYSPESLHPTKETVLFRATIPFESFDENAISCYSYPKNPGLQRCNIPKHPVFYCSDNSSICINETLNGKLFDTFPINLYLSTWNVSEERKWKILPLIFLTLPSVNKLHLYVEKNRKSLLEKYKDQISEKDIQSYIQFYHNEFRKKDTYKFSSIVSHKFLYEENNDIVIFPSVQVESEGNNYAINTKWINNKTFFCSKVYKYRIEKNDDLYSWYLEAEGIPKGNKIEWQNFKI